MSPEGQIKVSSLNCQFSLERNFSEKIGRSFTFELMPSLQAMAAALTWIIQNYNMRTAQPRYIMWDGYCQIFKQFQSTEKSFSHDQLVPIKRCGLIVTTSIIRSVCKPHYKTSHGFRIFVLSQILLL